MLLVCSVIASSISTNTTELKEKETISKEDKLTTTIFIENYKIERNELEDHVYIEDYGWPLIPGKPKLPTKIFAIAIPPGAEYVGLTFETGTEVELPGEYNILPTQLPKVIGVEDPKVREKEEKIYF